MAAIENPANHVPGQKTLGFYLSLCVLVGQAAVASGALDIYSWAPTVGVVLSFLVGMGYDGSRAKKKMKGLASTHKPWWQRTETLIAGGIALVNLWLAGRLLTQPSEAAQANITAILGALTAAGNALGLKVNAKKVAASNGGGA